MFPNHISVYGGIATAGLSAGLRTIANSVELSVLMNNLYTACFTLETTGIHLQWEFHQLLFCLRYYWNFWRLTSTQTSTRTDLRL